MSETQNCGSTRRSRRLGVGKRQQAKARVCFSCRSNTSSLSGLFSVGIECGVQSDRFQWTLSPTCRRRFLLPSFPHHHNQGIRLITPPRSSVGIHICPRTAGHESGRPVTTSSRNTENRHPRTPLSGELLQGPPRLPSLNISCLPRLPSQHVSLIKRQRPFGQVYHRPSPV